MRRLVAVALSCALLFSVAVMTLPMGSAAAAGRDVVLSTTYPSVTTGTGKSISFPLNFNNRGSSDESLTIEVQAPDGWNPTIQDRGFNIRELYVVAGAKADLSLSVTPPATIQPGDYNVIVNAKSADGGVAASLTIKVGITKDVVAGLKLDCQYPNLSGDPSSSFGFKVDLINQASEDRTISLSAQAPDGWKVTFSPSYDTKQISTLGVKAGSTQGLDISVTAPSSTASGDYTVKINAASGSDKASVDLKVTATGTGKMVFTTVSGNLTAEAGAGGETVLAAVVQNTGTADLQNISLAATTPDGWKVTFDPEKITTLKSGEMKQVNVKIQPASKAISGDYVVDMTATAGSVYQTMEIRTTVTTSTVWGIVSILIVGIVLVGMVGLYSRLGRR